VRERVVGAAAAEVTRGQRVVRVGVREQPGYGRVLRRGRRGVAQELLDRGRNGDISPQRRSARTPTLPPEANAGAAPERSARPPPPSEAQPAVTVLKSGVVDGMAYSLYSDGSIEAQMPEGMMRFASIDELRAHLDQRS